MHMYLQHICEQTFRFKLSHPQTILFLPVQTCSRVERVKDVNTNNPANIGLGIIVIRAVNVLGLVFWSGWQMKE